MMQKMGVYEHEQRGRKGVQGKGRDLQMHTGRVGKKRTRLYRRVLSGSKSVRGWSD